jgi:hypothetical protein
MQIRNRLKKLEDQTTHLNGGYCTCYVGLKYEVIPISMEEWNRRWYAGVERDERLPDYCESCRKPVDKSSIEITFEQHRENVNRRLIQAMETYAKHHDEL